MLGEKQLSFGIDRYLMSVAHAARNGAPPPPSRRRQPRVGYLNRACPPPPLVTARRFSTKSTNHNESSLNIAVQRKAADRNRCGRAFASSTSAFPEMLVEGVRRSWLTERSRFDAQRFRLRFHLHLLGLLEKPDALHGLARFFQNGHKQVFLERPDFPLVRDRDARHPVHAVFAVNRQVQAFRIHQRIVVAPARSSLSATHAATARSRSSAISDDSPSVARRRVAEHRTVRPRRA